MSVNTMSVVWPRVKQDSTSPWSSQAAEIGATVERGVVDRDRTGEVSVEAFELMRAAGLTSALLPTELGGGGASHTEMGDVLRVLARHDPATALALSMHTHVVAAMVWRHHHGIDVTAIAERLVDDRAVLISTGASDWISSNGTATRHGDGFRVHARKGPASGCEIGDLLVTSIRWDGAPEGPEVLHVAIPLTADGVHIERTWDTLGMRATGSHTVVLDDLWVPDTSVTLRRPAGRWHPSLNAVVGAAAPLIMSVYLGIADTAFDLARSAASGRVDAPTIQAIGEMFNAHTTAADTIAAMFADADDLRFDNTDEHASRALGRKAIAADALIETVRRSLEIIGGSGYSRSSGIERLYRDIHGCLFHPLPRARQTELSGRVALGLEPVEPMLTAAPH
jgi:acyl-CoA dehydrogenase